MTGGGFLARLGAAALFFVVAGCPSASVPESVHARADVQVTTQGLSFASIQSINGTYGAGCTARSGAWSARVSGTDPLANPPLSVVRNDSACVLTLTGLVTSVTYTGTPPIALTTEYQNTASAFQSGASVELYANAKLSSTTFASDFHVTVIVSADAVTASMTSTVPATLEWFGEGSSSQGAWDLIARRSPRQELTAASTWSLITAGADVSCGRRSNGTLWCWGENADGQLGSGDLVPRSSAVQVGTESSWTSVSTSGSHTCGVRSDGTLWCWGKNDAGQVGNAGVVTPQPNPVQVGTATTWNGVSVGGSHSCATRADGTLWCWGGNGSGELGLGNTTQQTSPVQVGAVATWNRVSAGASHTCATRDSGTLWCWGGNSSGQVGIGSVATPQASPVQIGSNTTWNGVVAASDGDHTCATRSDGSLWCWGSNAQAQLGINSVVTPQTSPVQVGTNSTWRNVSAGTHHSCATRADDTLWCWGKNDAGQAGIGSVATPQIEPTEVASASAWSAAAAGGAHVCALRTNGTLWCWGSSDSGQLGVGEFEDSNVSVQVGTATTWSKAAVGGGHACGTRGDGTLWCWGNNDHGQVGIGSASSTPQGTPVQVGSATTWKTITAGIVHTCATRSDGTLWCWGYNSSGQLGLGNTTEQTSPVQVGSGTTWDRVAAGSTHACATRSDGTLWCWGSNGSGQIGIGSTTSPQTAPVQVGIATTWSGVGAGALHTCATRTNGTLWCWGYNGFGQIGIGSTAGPQLSPVQVGVATSWRSVSLGPNHVCATRTGGTLWCWGDNISGQLGLGNTTQQTSPAQIGSATTWNTVASGSEHSCATQTDWTLWCWGLNTSGQVGPGSNVSPQLSPAQVSETSLVKGVYSGAAAAANLVTTTSELAQCGGSACLASACNDAVQNGGESAVDCGGGSNCARCGTATGCWAAGDCESRVCSGGVCQAATCSDSAQNGTESAVDCGGSCSDCGSGSTCNTSADCQSGVCSSNLCQAPTCSDAVQNGGESDVDCGGATLCVRCATSADCSAASDCSNGICSSNVCQAPTCSDGVKNQSETDVDCGGSCSNQCAQGAACIVSGDCATNHCAANACALRTADNPSSTSSGLHYRYYESDDYTSLPDFSNQFPETYGFATVFGVTQAEREDNFALVFNGYINVPTDGTYTFYTSSDDGSALYIGTTKVVDNDYTHAAQERSGSIGLRAGKHAIVVQYFDHALGSSLEVSYAGPSIAKQVIPAGVLYRTSCADTVKNGYESDVDCGGSCSACATAKICSAAADCQSRICTGGSCQAPTCSDGVKNQTETDIDCGGSCASDCADGAACSVNGDCASGICAANTCGLRTADNPSNTSSGLHYRYYESDSFTILPDFSTLFPKTAGLATTFGVTQAERTDNFALLFDGYINVPSDGTYTFYTSSDDGSALYIGSEKVVDNDYTHASQERSGSIGLRAGKHAIQVRYFDSTDENVLEVRYSGPSIFKQLIPAGALYRTSCVDSAYVFCDGFDDGNSTGWSQIDQSTMGSWSVGTETGPLGNSTKDLRQSVSADTNYKYLYASGASFGPWGNQTITAWVKPTAYGDGVGGSSYKAGVCVRYNVAWPYTNSVATGYCMFLRNDSRLEFVKKSSGVSAPVSLGNTTVNVPTFPVGTWRKLKITVTGTTTVTLTGFVDDVQLLQVTDSTSPITTGYPAFVQQGAAANYDDVTLSSP